MRCLRMLNRLRKWELPAGRKGPSRCAKRRSSGEGQREIPNEDSAGEIEVKAREIGVGRLRMDQSTQLRSMVSEKVAVEGQFMIPVTLELEDGCSIACSYSQGSHYGRRFIPSF